MSDAPFDIRIDTEGTLERLSAQMERMPAAVDRAKKRALKKMMTWLKRQVLRAAAQAADVPQKVLSALLRYRATQREDDIKIWIGTNPVQAHHLGTVRWTRRMQGARAGKKLFAGSFSWNRGKTSGLIMQRTTEKRLPIEVVTVPIHEAILKQIEAMQPEIAERYERLMLQELNYALNVEAARG